MLPYPMMEMSKPICRPCSRHAAIAPNAMASDPTSVESLAFADPPMNVLDYCIVVIYLALIIWLGMRFKNNEAGADHFLGGRQFGWFALCMSTMATQLSAISFLSAPAFVGLRRGGGMQWLTFEFAVPQAMIVVMVLLGAMLIGGLFLYASSCDTDQTQAQRILSAKNELTVKRLLLFNGFLRFPITLAYCMGGLILGTFAMTNAEFGAKIPANKPDLMIPVFISDYLPHDVIGLIVVALIAAWMSAYSSALNSLTAVTMEDFIGRKFDVPKEKYVTHSKLVAMGWGAFSLFFGFFTGKIAATAIEAINQSGSIFYGPILGIFLLAAIGRSIKPFAANPGVVIGVLVNLTLWLFFKNVFWFWWNAIGGITTVLVGVTSSMLSPVSTAVQDSTPEAPREIPRREIAVLATYFVAIVTFSLLLPRFLQS